MRCPYPRPYSPHSPYPPPPQHTHLPCFSRYFELVRENFLDAKEWRLRKAAIGSLTSSSFGGEGRGEMALEGIVNAMGDKVASVRVSGVEGLVSLLGALGMPWFEANAVPILQKAYHTENLSDGSGETKSSHLRRITVLTAIKCIAEDDALIESNVASQAIELLVSIMEEAASDEVPNVRLFLAKLLPAVVRATAGGQSANATTFLNSMSSDADADVAFFANHALGQI